MKNSKFENLQSGMFDASQLQGTQLKAITGGATTWTNLSGSQAGTDHNKNGHTTYSDGNVSDGDKGLSE
jgi:hypothetical protein